MPEPRKQQDKTGKPSHAILALLPNSQQLGSLSAGISMADVKLLARVPGQVKLVAAAAPDNAASFPAEKFVISEKGQLLAAAGEEQVVIYKVPDAEQVGTLPLSNVVLMAFSPGGSLLVTCQRPTKDAAGQPSKNLKVWDVSTLTTVFEVTLKDVTKESWPACHFSSDDKHILMPVTNNVQIYTSTDSFKVYRKVTVKGLTTMSVSPGPSPVLAAFTPEVKAAPAAVSLVSWAEGGTAEPPPLVRRSFFRTQGARFQWNCSGSAVLALCYADYDATNKSYYGEQKLYYFPADAARADNAGPVPLPKEGPVHDVQWSPKGDRFVAVAGYMPAQVTVFNDKCKVLHDLGCGPYNMVRWSPFSSAFFIAGFGNLPGDIIFYHAPPGPSPPMQLGAVRQPSVSADWAPDGRHIMAATTAPRMRVDNAVHVFSYSGAAVKMLPFEVLLEALWSPVAPGTYQERPPSPATLAAAKSSAGGAKTGPVGAASAPAYVPPSARAAGGARHSTLPPGFSADPAPGGGGGGGSKNAKKRANKKKGKEGEGGDDDEATEAPPAAAAPTSQPPAGDAAGGGEGDALKRARALQKKLRQIQQLKEKLAKEGPAALEPEQRQKIETEAALVSELKALGFNE